MPERPSTAPKQCFLARGARFDMLALSGPRGRRDGWRGPQKGPRSPHGGPKMAPRRPERPP
eukprot:7472125-Pyramimonas_sp.AAC.1